MANSNTPTVPYPAGSLSPPLTSAQRAAVIKYLNATSAYALGWQLLDDADLISAYNKVVASPPKDVNVPVLTPAITAGGDVISATESVGTFLGQLSNPNFWTRALELTIGVVILAVGLHSIGKGSNPSYAQAKSTSGKLRSLVPKV